jgi:hypothetical protein
VLDHKVLRCIGTVLRLATALMLTTGCRGARSTRGSSPSATAAVASELPAATATPDVVCTERRATVIDAHVDYGALQNLRIAADAQGALLTWERLNTPDTGDSFQVGFGALVGSSDADVVTVAMPARAYASAAYTTVAPSTIEGHLDFVAHGVAGKSDFRTYAAGLRAWKGIKIFEDEGPKPRQTATPPFGPAESLAVAPKVPLALLAGIETPCGNRYDCPELFEPVEQRGFPKSLRTLSFVANRAYSEILFKGTIKTPKKPFLPAVATSGERGLVAYRVDDQLRAQWVTLDGKAAGDALSVGPSGDVGAPTVTMSGDLAYVIWANRVRAADGYRLWVARIARNGVELTAPLDTGTQSAFAPAVAAHNDELVVTWMQGDGGRRGTIRLGRVSIISIAPGHDAIPMHAIEPQTPDDGNRRDPEIAIDGDRTYLAWSDFTARTSGIPVLRVLECR